MASLNSDTSADSVFKDQGFTHHIVTYKTNTIYIPRDDISIDKLIGKVEEMLHNDEFMPILFRT